MRDRCKKILSVPHEKGNLPAKYWMKYLEWNELRAFWTEGFLAYNFKYLKPSIFLTKGVLKELYEIYKSLEIFSPRASLKITLYDQTIRTLLIMSDWLTIVVVDVEFSCQKMKNLHQGWIRWPRYSSSDWPIALISQIVDYRIVIWLIA